MKLEKPQLTRQTAGYFGSTRSPTMESIKAHPITLICQVVRQLHLNNKKDL